MLRRHGRRYLVPIILLILTCTAIVLIGAGRRYNQLDQAIQVLAQVKLRFVERVSAVDLFRSYLRTGTIDGMLSALHDPYTRYLTPPEYRELRSQTQGTMGGVGITLNTQGKYLVIMKALKGSPGEAAGLRRGDRIIKVNGRQTSKMTVEEAVAAIRGPAGTYVRLTISRGAGNAAHLFEVRIKRANIRLPSVEWEMVDDPEAGRIEIITLSQFAERTAAELEEALRDAERNAVRGLILDLRYNPGGLLDSAVYVAGKFLDGGVVLYMVRRDGDRKPFYAPKNRLRRYPLVVLVNEWSASASEIVAGALKDRHAATLVGTRTFGKGVVQEIVPISGGAALSVTIAKYLTAGGRSINKVGVEPDVVVDLPGAMARALKEGRLEDLQRLERLQRERAIAILRARLVRAKTAS